MFWSSWSPLAQNLFIAAFMIWEGVWKAFALWFAGKNRQKAWFVFLFIFNTLGILPIIYLFAFRKDRKQKPARKYRR